MGDLTYGEYLKVSELLHLQQPLSDGPEHDELLFIVIHQTYELWFKQILHELVATQVALEGNDFYRSLALVGRIRTILKTLVSQVDILETMTPLQFNSFRSRLESSSGFQSAQFREFEAVLGRRDGIQLELLSQESREKVESALQRRSLWGSALVLLAHRGHNIPKNRLDDATSQHAGPDESVQRVLVDVYRNDAEAALLLERLVDLDEGVQEWRYRHVKMVERTIGNKMGTGGSSGVNYLASTLFNPIFPDLWAVRSQF